MKNQSTGYSPAEMLYGYQLSMPCSYKQLAEQENFEQAWLENISSWRSGIVNIRLKGLENIIKDKEKVIQRYNKSILWKEYRVNEQELKKVDDKGKFELIWMDHIPLR
ncbi:hypothetical protein BB560_003519 [Smittium megazygosporum]|uniref:Uncharacterized protein n=1 Tax=Smittium megazygosporum TaxID=133381 RepID=A0A2T9ZBS3_9FUNG|nr:hypothetical protein BB560_003519 [Smittium megazygosporum]